MTAELRGASTRTLGDSGTVWSRRHSVTPIPRLEAATLAVRSLMHGEAPAPAPMIWSPS